MGRSRLVTDLKMCAETLLGAYYDPPDPYPTPLDPEIFIDFFRKKCIFGPSEPMQAKQAKSAHGRLQWGGPGRFPTLKCERKHLLARIMTPQTHIRPTWTQKFSSFFFRKKCIFGPSYPIQAEQPKSAHGPLQWGGAGRFPTLKCVRKRFWVRIMTP